MSAIPQLVSRFAYLRSTNIIKKLLRPILIITIGLFVAYNILWISYRQTLSDFGAFIASAQLAEAGSNPYSTDHPLIKEAFGSTTINLNPPISVLLFLPFAKFDPSTLQRAWLWMSTTLLIGMIFYLLRKYRVPASKILWIVPFTGIWSTLYNGQIYPILLAGVILALYFFEKQRLIPAGLVIGLIVALKPNFGLWLLFLFAAGFSSVVFAAAASFAAATFAPIMVFGIGIYRQWFDAIASHGTFIGYPANGSIYFLAHTLGIPWLSTALSILIVLFLLILVRRNYLQPDKISSLAISGALVLSPFAWPGYTIMLLPSIIQGWNKYIWIAIILYAIPLQLISMLWGNYPIFRYWYLAALLLFFAGSIYTSSLSQGSSLLKVTAASE